MTTYHLQLQHTSEQSAAGDWQAVAAVLTADIVSPYNANRSYNEVLSALGASDMEHTLAAFSTSQIGSDGREMLCFVGLQFSHPTTVALINQLEASAALRPGVAAKLLALGTQTTRLAQGITADQCRVDWLTGKIQQRLVNAAARMAELITIEMTVEEQAAACDQAWREAV